MAIEVAASIMPQGHAVYSRPLMTRGNLIHTCEP